MTWSPDFVLVRLEAALGAAQAEGFAPVEVCLNHRDWIATRTMLARLSVILGDGVEVTEAGAEGYFGDSELIGWKTWDGEGLEKRFPVISRNGPLQG